ncbi:MAG: cytochrome P450 [Hamadaea sp.]|uniref:cytochrome P450 n=1 Tax=Hamadaea sp. TaxID=2024425 RepID=UPI00180C1533|nr:cytochrome P450 [Hamadaea sp.]NUR73113.1 cytochrome P450 [Hamadaea sp.]NUT23025.1 cytochrome P450 [Hamadaea sp.]
MLFRTWEASADSPVAIRDSHVLVSSHTLVRQVLADPETFAPHNALDAVTPIPVAALRVLAGHGFRLPPTLANNGTPSHPAIRGLVEKALHPHRVAALQPWLTGIVRRRVASLAIRLRSGEPVDLYADLTSDLPLLALARLVDLPDDDVRVVKEFSRAALELFWAPVDLDRQLALAEIVGHYHAVLRKHAEQGEGMIAELRTLGDPDLVVGALFFLLVAGQETTSQFLTLLLHRLTTEPAVLAGLARGSMRVDDVVEEGLRLVPPITTWRRVATRAATLGGVEVPAGASILLWLAEAGRDPSITAEPHDFVPGQRGSRRHLAFGAGAHRCVGAQLSRMEAAVVVAEAAGLLRYAEVVRAPWCPDNLSFRMPDTFQITGSGRRS